MKKRIYRILSIVLCLQLVFGLIPIGFDHDHEGLMLTAYAWDVESTCEFCGGFIADDYICDCGEGGDHCSAESGRNCYEENHCSNCLSGVGEANICGNCGAGCKNCAEICEGCGISCENCCERFCNLCGLCFYCVEDYGWCYSCDVCGNCTTVCFCEGGCAECTNVCPSCAESCGICGDEFCEECGRCKHCADGNGWCSNCSICGDCKVTCFEGDGCTECTNVCPDCTEHCGNCWDEFCPECGVCSACTGSACQSCGMCENCADLICYCGQTCTSCGDVCLACGEQCEKCSEEMCGYCDRCKNCAGGYGWCSDCNNCGDCVTVCICDEGCSDCTKVCPECGEHCGKCWDDICPNCGICSDCADGYCTSCGMCSECTLICKECGDACLDCASEWCGNCELCGDCVDWICPNIDHCSNCLSGDGTHCESCGTCKYCVTLCTECMAICDECTDFCPRCLTCEGCSESTCPNCDLCNDCAENYCGNCGMCSECTLICKECGDACLDCASEWCGNCELCGDCVDWVCPNIDHCSNCLSGDGTHCESCGTCQYCVTLCTECMAICDECIDFCTKCLTCADCSEYLCPDCGRCDECVDQFCHDCGTCSDCTVICKECGEICRDCTDICPNCDVCRDCVGGELCPECGECENCGKHCQGCGTCENCKDICPDCEEHCANCAVMCPDCTRCEDCVEDFCPNCGTCAECARDDNGMCDDCHYCGNCATLCTDCAALCRDCAQTCASCGICEQCEAFCDSCELCVVCCADVSSSYGCSHDICVESDEWKTHYCTAGGHCTTTLGEQDYDDDEHWYWCGDGCTAKVNVEPHVFSSAEITTQPTKTDEGVLTYYCDCGYSKTETIPVITEEGHTHHCVPAVVAATCTSGGYTVYTCECGYSYRANETPALGHTYEYQKDAGGHWLKCSFCTDEKPAAAHKFGAWTVTKDATYTQPGTKQRTCLTCGYADEAEIPVIGHAGHFVISFEGTDIGDMLSVGASHKVPELPVLPPKEEGNLFDGWTDQKTGAPVKAGDVLTGDIVLTPVWKDCGDGSHTDSDHDLVCDDCGKKFPAPVSYLILEGANSTWRKGSLTGLSFRSSADVAKFDGVTVDGTAIDAGCYSAELGSTRITLRAEYLETLSAGSHTLVIKAIDGTADTSFTVLEAETAEPGGSNVVDADLFALDQPCTRAQITFLLWRAAGSPEPKAMSSFVDVSADAYYAKAVAWAVETGIVAGTSETTFGPDDPCTRAQIIFLLWCAAGSPEPKAMSSFVDVPADAYYAKAVAWAVETGIVAGTSETTFGPDEICICAQALDAFHRVNPE